VVNGESQSSQDVTPNRPEESSASSTQGSFLTKEPHHFVSHLGRSLTDDDWRSHGSSEGYDVTSEEHSVQFEKRKDAGVPEKEKEKEEEEEEEKDEDKAKEKGGQNESVSVGMEEKEQVMEKRCEEEEGGIGEKGGGGEGKEAAHHHRKHHQKRKIGKEKS
jgi:hypothetical protein